MAFFDSNIIIDAINNKREAEHAIESQDTHSISIIVWIEVMSGKAILSDIERVTAFLKFFEIAYVDEGIAVRTAQIRRDIKMKTADAIILATARQRGQQLITRDIKDFPLNDPEIIVPYQV